MTLSYPRDAGTVLDLGCLGPDGFRGWSGGARDSFVVSELGATPGYLAGPVTAGLWQVMIGLYLVPADGVPFTVTAEVTRRVGRGTHPGARRGGRRRAGVRRGTDWQRDGRRGGRWRRRPGDGAAAPGGRAARAAGAARPGRPYLAGRRPARAHRALRRGDERGRARGHAVERGLDFVAVTDHNTVSQHACLGPLSARYGVTLLPGQEVTTELGHAGVLGDTGWIDFREPAAAWLTAAESAGGLMSVNHPFAGAGLLAAPDAKAPAAA